MYRKLIYEKRFPCDELMAAMEAGKQEEGAIKPPMPLQKMFDSIQERTLCIPIRKRRKTSKAFIRAAIEASEACEWDIEIVRYESHISVTYSFDCGGGIQGIGKVFSMADEFSFIRRTSGLELSISLDYYTHYEFRGAKIVAPFYKDLRPQLEKLSKERGKRKNGEQP